MVGAVLEFHVASSSLDPNEDDRNSDYNFDQQPDFDLDTIIGLSVTDENTGADSNTINVTTSTNNDPPHAILTYETSCSPIAPGCDVTIFGGWSYDPDESDSVLNTGSTVMPPMDRRSM